MRKKFLDYTEKENTIIWKKEMKKAGVLLLFQEKDILILDFLNNK